MGKTGPLKPMVMVLWCIILTTPLSGQTGISYSYDSAGNRISRVTSSENVASTAETPHGFHEAEIADSVRSLTAIHVPDGKGQTDRMQFHLFNPPRLMPDSRIEDNPVPIPFRAPDKVLERFALISNPSRRPER